MNMVSMQISIPQDMAAVIENASEEMTFERNALWLYPYIRSMKISHGRAADVRDQLFCHPKVIVFCRAGTL